MIRYTARVRRGLAFILRKYLRADGPAASKVDIMQAIAWLRQETGVTEAPGSDLNKLAPPQRARMDSIYHGALAVIEKHRANDDAPRCAECGEYWPCSDSKRRDIPPTIVAKHRKEQT